LDSLKSEEKDDRQLGVGKQLIRSVEIIAKNAQIMENLTHDLLTLVSLEDEERAGDKAPGRLEMIQVSIVS
jgi:polyhydroxyalkanoate synthesis regulator protein